MAWGIYIHGRYVSSHVLSRHSSSHSGWPTRRRRALRVLLVSSVNLYGVKIIMGGCLPTVPVCTSPAYLSDYKNCTTEELRTVFQNSP